MESVYIIIQFCSISNSDKVHSMQLYMVKFFLGIMRYGISDKNIGKDNLGCWSIGFAHIIKEKIVFVLAMRGYISTCIRNYCCNEREQFVLPFLV